MKRFRLIFFFASWLPGAVLATNPSVEVTRSIEHTYAAEEFNSLEIRSQQGQIQVHTWDKAEIELQIVIRARANTEEKANARLASVEIRERTFGSQLQLESQIADLGPFQLSKLPDLEINYEIFLPEQHALAIHHRFGDILLGSRRGNVDVNLQGGTLRADSLYGLGNRLELSKGRAEIDSVAGMDLNLSLAEVDIQAAGQVYVRSQTSRLTLVQAQEVDLVSHLGELEFGRIGHLKGRYTSSPCKIENLVHSLDLEVKYAPALEIESIQPGFERIALEGNATGFRLNFEHQASFDLEAAVSHGEMEAADWEESLETENEGNERSYRIRAGETARSNQAPGSVSINNRYGKVKLFRKQGMQY